MAPLSEQIATLEAKAAVVDEIRVLLGGTADGVSAAQIAHLERELATAKAIIEARDNEIENLANARRADGKENDALRAKLIETLRERDEMEERLGHVLGAARADLRSAAARLGERFEGDHETDDLPTLASKFDTAIAGLLEDYECAKTDAKPAKPLRGKPGELARRIDEIEKIADDAHAVLVKAGAVGVLGGMESLGVETKVHNLRAFIRQRFARDEASTNTQEEEKAAGVSAEGLVGVNAHEPAGLTSSTSVPAKHDGDVAPPTVGDPFVIMRTIPKLGRQLLGVDTSAGVWVLAVEQSGFAQFGTADAAERIKANENLRRTRVCRLSEALASPKKVNPPRVEVLAHKTDEGPFVVCTSDGNGKRAWHTTSQGLMCIPRFTEAQAAAEDGNDPIAEFELLEEARGAAKELSASMPNAGSVCVIEVHDVGALVVAEERRAAE